VTNRDHDDFAGTLRPRLEDVSMNSERFNEIQKLAGIHVSAPLQECIREIKRLHANMENLKDELACAQEDLANQSGCCLIEGRCEHGEAGFL